MFVLLDIVMVYVKYILNYQTSRKYKYNDIRFDYI